MTVDIETIFNLWGFPKERTRPPAKDVTRKIAWFSEEEFHIAVRYLGSYKGRMQTKTKVKVLFLYEEAGRRVLELVEMDRGQDNETDYTRNDAGGDDSKIGDKGGEGVQADKIPSTGEVEPPCGERLERGS